MSQKLVFNLLRDLGGCATIREINEAARQKYPNRSVVSYTNKRLKSLEKKCIVEKNIVGDETVWQIVDDHPSVLSTHLNYIDDEVTGCELLSFGLSISNIVATIELDADLDLYELAGYLKNSSYEPESNSALIYRESDISSVTFMIPSSGRSTVVGAKEKGEVKSSIRSLIKKLERIGYCIQPSPDEAIIQNLVVVGNIGQEVDLAELTLHFGMEQTEFDPESFPGLVYRSGNHTVILYRSGKYVITGLSDYKSVLDAAQHFICELPDEVTTTL